MSNEKLMKLIGEAYDAAIEPHEWRGYLRGLLDALNCCAGNIVLFDRKTDSWCPGSEVITADAGKLIADYLEWGGDAPQIEPMKTLPTGQHCALSADLVSDADLVSTEYYNEIVRPHRLLDNIGCFVPVGSDLELRVILYAELGSPGCGRAGLELMQRLAPHLARATQATLTINRLNGERDVLERALDHLGQGVILTDETGRAVWANKPAERLLRDESSGLSVRCGVLRCSRSREAERLKTLVRNTVISSDRRRPATGGSMAVRRATSGCTALSVLPLRNGRSDHASTPGASAAIFLSSSEPPASLSERLLCVMYELTPAEARVARRLVCGESPSEVANAHDVTVRTVHNQLAAIFTKTGTRRQSELIRKILLSLP